MGGSAVLTWREDCDSHGSVGSTNVQRHYESLLSRPFFVNFLFTEWRFLKENHYGMRGIGEDWGGERRQVMEGVTKSRHSATAKKLSLLLVIIDPRAWLSPNSMHGGWEELAQFGRNRSPSRTAL